MTSIEPATNGLFTAAVEKYRIERTRIIADAMATILPAVLSKLVIAFSPMGYVEFAKQALVPNKLSETPCDIYIQHRYPMICLWRVSFGVSYNEFDDLSALSERVTKIADSLKLGESYTHVISPHILAELLNTKFAAAMGLSTK